MTRNHLLKLSTRPLAADHPSVWRMSMTILGLAFGAPVKRRENQE